MHTRILISLITLLLLPVLTVSAQRQVPIAVGVQQVDVDAKSGGPLLIRVTIANNFSQEIRFESFFRGPDSWDGGATNIALHDIYRDSQTMSVFKARPTPPSPGSSATHFPIAGITSKVIKPGESLSMMIDISKWQIVDGWTKGKYRLVLRVDNVVVDDYAKVSVKSDPVEIEVK